MVATNLAYIEDAIDSAVGREITTTTIPPTALKKAAEKALTVVAGFSLLDASEERRAVEESRNARLSALKEYREDRTKLVTKLMEQGITPLAIVPSVAWKRLCLMSGLFCLSPDDRGDVYLSSAVLDRFSVRAGHIHKDWVFSMIIASLAMMPATYFLVFPWWAYLATFVGSFCLTIFLAWANDWDTSDLSDFFAKKLVNVQIWGFSWKPWAKILKEFFPDNISAPHGLSAKVVLPTPPQEIADTLLKARKLELKVAAVPDAIAFSEAPSTILRREHRLRADKETQERRRIRDLKKDPIVYHEHGSATAIIAQFGDFPMEKRVVDAVISSEHLI